MKALWKTGNEFQKHFPGESQYRHSLPEEAEALTAAAERFKETGGSDPSQDLLLKLHHSGLIQPYVLFSLGDSGIARDYDGYRADHRQKLEAYLEQFVVPPATPDAAE